MTTMRCGISRIAETEGLEAALNDALSWVQWERLIGADARIFVKPNLTWKLPSPGVTTSPAFLETLIRTLTSRSRHVSIVESDGGYASFRAEESFQGHGLHAFAQKYGVSVINLSRLPSESVTVDIDGPVTVKLPSILLHEADAFITAPVPKMHAMTRVSLGFKNQWGCQPDPMRLRNHPDFDRKILAINQILRPALTVFDGTYFLDLTGPMVGKPVKMDLIIAADHVGAGTLACCEIMGIDPSTAPHLRLAQRLGMMPHSVTELACNQAPASFRRHRFTLTRSPLNYVALAGFRSHLGMRLLYDSPTAERLHELLYLLRKTPYIGRFLHGPLGPSAAG